MHRTPAAATLAMAPKQAVPVRKDKVKKEESNRLQGTKLDETSEKSYAKQAEATQRPPQLVC